LRPCRNVLRETVADDPKAQVSIPKLVDHDEDLMLDLLERFCLCAGPVGAHALHGGTFSAVSEPRSNVAECLEKRHMPDGHSGTKRVPLPAESLSLAPKLWSQRGHTRRPGSRFRDQRLEQIEEDSPHHQRARLESV
jgi:hypothetical protein